MLKIKEVGDLIHFLLSTEKRDWIRGGKHQWSFPLNRDCSTFFIFSTEVLIGSSTHRALAQSGFYQEISICLSGLRLHTLFFLDLLTYEVTRRKISSFESFLVLKLSHPTCSLKTETSNFQKTIEMAWIKIIVIFLYQPGNA